MLCDAWIFLCFALRSPLSHVFFCWPDLLDIFTDSYFVLKTHLGISKSKCAAYLLALAATRFDKAKFNLGCDWLWLSLLLALHG